MKPYDLYALPTLHTRPWYDAGGAMLALFGRPLDDYDADMAERMQARDLAFEAKIDRYVGQDDGLTYEAATFRGNPFALIARIGTRNHVFVTDFQGYETARDYAEHHLLRLSPELHEPDDDIPELDEPYGHVIRQLGRRTEFVPRGHLSPEGQPVFDHRAFDAAFDALVRPGFPDTAAPGFRAGLDGQAMQELGARAILAALAPGVTGTAAFSEPTWPEGRAGLGWTGIVARDATHAYALGIERHAPRISFTWARHIGVVRLGPAALYETLVA